MADIYARQRQLIGSSADWAAHDLTIGHGELAVERLPGGELKMKVGDGVLPYSALPYWPQLPSAFTYRGSASVTAAPPPSNPNDAWSAAADGTVAASWGAPAAGTVVDKGDLLAMASDGTWNVIPQGIDPDGLVKVVDLASSGGAGMVGFTQTGIYNDGTVGRRLGDFPRSVKSAPYFAEAAADDTQALQALASSGDADISLAINQTMRISSSVTFTDKNLNIIGNGRSASEIRFTNNAGLKFVSTPNSNLLDTAHALNVKGVSLICDQANAAGGGPTAIEAEWGFTGSGNLFRTSFDDVLIRSGGAGKFWNKGIRLIDACRVHLSNIEIYNEDGWGGVGNGSAAIELVRKKASNITGFFIDNYWLGQFAHGLMISQAAATAGAGTVEGLYMNAGEIVNVAYAIKEDNSANLAGYYLDSVSILNSHWNFSRAGFRSGRSRSINLNAMLIFCDNWGDPIAVAPIEAAVNILTESQALHVQNSHLLRNSATTAAAPAIRLPTAANLSWCRLEGNQFGNWQYVANSPGTLTTEGGRLFIGKNTRISTPYIAGYGFKGDQSTIGGHADVATGAAISFGHTFNGAPYVVLSSRSATYLNFKISNLTSTGFTLDHNGAGVQSFSWTATGE